MPVMRGAFGFAVACSVCLPAAWADFRLGPEGEVSPSVPSGAPGTQREPTVAWTGTHHFVAWIHEVNTATTQIRGSRVSPDGRVLDPIGLPLGPTSPIQYHPQLSWNGRNLLLTWYESRSGVLGQYARRLTVDGSVIDEAPISVSTAETEPAGPAEVVWDGTQHWVAWSSERAIDTMPVFAARVTPDGSVVDRPALALAPGSPQKGRLLSMAAGDGQVLVAWAQKVMLDSPAFDPDVYGVRLSTQGKLLDPAPVPLVQEPDLQTPLAISWNGASFLLAYTDRSGASLRGVRIDAGGSVLTPGGFPLFAPDSSAGTPVALGWNGQEHLLVWSRRSVPGYGLWTGRLSTSGTEPTTDLASLAETATGRWVERPRVSLGGPHPFAVWEEGGLGTAFGDIVGVRIAGSGGSVEARPFLVSTAGNPQFEVALASNGRQLFAVWVDERTAGTSECWGTRLLAGGEILDPAGIRLSETGGFCSRPALTWNGRAWTVAWLQARSESPSEPQIRVMQVEEDGAAAGSSVPLSDFGFEAGPLALASDGQRVIVVWQHLASEGTGWDLLAQRIEGSGVRVDAQPFVLSSATLNQRDPDVVWNGQGYLAAWSDERHGYAGVYASPVTPGGQVSSPMGLRLSSARIAESPRIAWNGEHHLVAWVESGETFPIVRAARVSRDGQLIDSRTFESDRGASGRPAATAVGATFAVAWREDVYPGPKILITRLGAALEPLGPPRLEVVPPTPGAALPALATAGAGTVIAYQVHDPAFDALRVRLRAFGEDAPDAGIEPDAGNAPFDAAEAPPDAHLPDAEPDASAARDDAAEGCHCAVARRSRPAAPTLLVTIILAFLLRRRARRCGDDQRRPLESPRRANSKTRP
jgi:hypothetical protein